MPSSFVFVRIPYDRKEEIEEIRGDTSGGLTDDFLISHARAYFTKHADPSATKPLDVESMSDEQKRQIVAQVRKQVSNLDGVKDDVILSMYAASQSGSNSCEIIALTVPTEANHRTAVSMYLDSNAPANDAAKENLRAMALMQGCGHEVRKLHGDVFVGRAHDDELKDIWTRLDFTKEDVSPESEWCRVARSAAGGGGSGSSPAHSLSGTVSKSIGRTDSSAASPVQQTPSMDGTEIRTDGYVWSQTNDEVEVKFATPSNTNSKDVKVKFQRKALSVTVSGQTVLAGKLGGTIVVDESTYTLQDSFGGGRELCLTMAKDSPGSLWLSVVIDT